MPPRRRPTAYEASFPDEVGDEPLGVLRKRKNEEDSDSQNAKRFQLPPAAIYKPVPGVHYAQETEEIVIPGEDHADNATEAEDKPIRRLAMFSVFDPTHSNELVALGMLEHDDGVDRQFEATGELILTGDEDDEDEGQEDALRPFPIRLSAILRSSVDYTDPKAPFFIETLYAWYILERPARQYEKFYEHFYSPRRVAQLVISECKEKPTQTFEVFLPTFLTENGLMPGTKFREQDIWKSMVEIEQALEDMPYAESIKLRATPLLKYILKRSTNHPVRPRRQITPAVPRRPLSTAVQNHAGDRDFAVLKAENQNATHVTPFVASLARGLVSENVIVVGPPPPPMDKDIIARQRAQATRKLKDTVMRATKPKIMVDYDKADRIDVQADIYSAVIVEGIKFKVGDTVILKGDSSLPGWNSNGSAAPIKDEHQLCDFFWFGRIMYFVIGNQKAHVQWFYHGMRTLMGELGHPQELLLSQECGHVPLKEVIGHIQVHNKPKDIASVPYNEYFCKFMYEKSIGVIRSIDAKAQKLCDSLSPPDNCSSCSLMEATDFQTEPHRTKDAKGKTSGIAYGGTNYHLEDFVLYNSGEGPANIGQIVHIDFSQPSSEVLTLFKVGRAMNLVNVAPAPFYRDERHLYLTQEKVKVPIKQLHRVVYAASSRIFDDDEELVDWLDLSPYHYYIKYRFPKLKVSNWDERRKLDWKQLFACSICCKEMLQKRKKVKQFLRQMEREPLATMDLFGGVGAFSGSLGEGSRCFKVVYGIEISPSASKTFQKNWKTKVANQCANIMLRYAIKSKSGHDVQVPKQLYDNDVPVPPMPKQGDIKVLTAGFPCQSHSTLNMFHKADDIKSNLMLTTLSYVDWYRPTYVYLENVPGFLSYALNARQATKHRVEGGIKMGGLKLLVRALTEMGYQVRFALLQAGSYGTPQRRVRFFLVAALDGHPLPEMPQPTHDFLGKKLKIDCFDGEVNPISVLDGKAAHPLVTIEAAIGDLLRFDFAHPRPEKLSLELRKTLEKRKTRLKIASVKCVAGEKYWGFTGKLRYQTEPMTAYQKRSRMKETTNIQHFVQPMKLAVAERVMYIPLKADADYRDLPRSQHEWQFVDPMSSHGQKNYKPGAYTRLNANTFFSTIVTNFGPTAKQSKVLHHSCLRTNTIRELARGQGFPDWFVFQTLSGNVKHIQRQIGNAVPWQIGHALGRELREGLFKQWMDKLEEAIRIDDSGSDDDGDVAMAGPQVQVPMVADDDDDDMEDMYV